MPDYVQLIWSESCQNNHQRSKRAYVHKLVEIWCVGNFTNDELQTSTAMLASTIYRYNSDWKLSVLNQSCNIPAESSWQQDVRNYPILLSCQMTRCYGYSQ